MKKRTKRKKRSKVGISKDVIQEKSLTKSTTLVSDSGMSKRREITCEVAKVDAELGMVYGWAIICTEKGEPYIDLQNEHIPDPVMLDATVDFAKGLRVAKEMHDGPGRGSVLHLFPLTADIAKSLGITSERTGLLIGMNPDDAMMEKFKSGELTGFSIGGYASAVEVEYED